jgi:RNA polymerase sigma factor (sigma-70 family)
LFRQQAGKMTAVLSRILGFHNIDTAEELVQDTLLTALQVWSFRGVPRNPAAWLMTAARNRAIDHIRRERSRLRASEDLQQQLRSEWTLSSTVSREFEESRIRDHLLRMIFTCCDPRLPLEDQVALTLKFPGGFSTGEIAAALICEEEAVRKRLYRARQRLREDREAFQMPPDSTLHSRLDAVLQVVYLIFSEGYKSADGQSLIRAELCEEALRLGSLLADYPPCSRPETFALLALMHFQAARLSARTYEDGSICQLEQQDRSAWDAGLIAEGFKFLDLSAAGAQLTRYHVEAAIAACHCGAPTFEQTDWPLIVSLYGKLVAIYDTPIVRLNRAIAVGFAEGPRAAIRDLEQLRDEGALARYYLLPASLGEFQMKAGELPSARTSFRQAAELCRSQKERDFLARRIEWCAAHAGDT